MEKYSPEKLDNLTDIAGYWEQCLSMLKPGEDDTIVASRMVDVVNNIHDNDWSDSANGLYSEVFQLAASLELPGGNKQKRAEDWEKIKKLLAEMREIIK